MNEKFIKVMVGGGFDPVHSGHIDHIKKAAKLGNWLIVAINPDEHLILKKGYCFMPLKERILIIKAIGCVDEVVVNIDTDGTCAKTLEMVRPDKFAKGGDREPDNMPQNEIDICDKLGISIVYGVGDLLNSSTKIVNEAKRYV